MSNGKTFHMQVSSVPQSQFLLSKHVSSFNPISSEATWENGKLIEERCQEQIRAYKEREESR